MLLPSLFPESVCEEFEAWWRRAVDADLAWTLVALTKLGLSIDEGAGTIPTTVASADNAGSTCV